MVDEPLWELYERDTAGLAGKVAAFLEQLMANPSAAADLEGEASASPPPTSTVSSSEVKRIVWFCHSQYTLSTFRFSMTCI